MGALAAAATWTAEDDFNLKSAVEAGASLEALSKGVMQFSHRFTLKEIQDRWYKLLYDPQTSAEASARILEFEVEPAVAISTKASKAVHSKGKDVLPQKRKVESIRHMYYAMRKRVSSEQCNPADLSFVMEACACAVKPCSCRDSLGHHVSQNLDAEDLSYFGQYPADDYYCNEVTMPHQSVDNLDGVGYDSSMGNNAANIQYPCPNSNVALHTCPAAVSSICMPGNINSPAVLQQGGGMLDNNMIRGGKCDNTVISGDVDERSLVSGFNCSSLIEIELSKYLEMESYLDADAKDEPSLDSAVLSDSKPTEYFETYSEVHEFLHSDEDNMQHSLINTGYDVDTGRHGCGIVQPLTSLNSQQATSTFKVLCLLNTEDTEIPANGGIVKSEEEMPFPVLDHDAKPHCHSESSSSLLCNDRNADGGDLVGTKVEKEVDAMFDLTSNLKPSTSVNVAINCCNVKPRSFEGSLEGRPSCVATINNSSTTELAMLQPMQDAAHGENCCSYHLRPQNNSNNSRDTCKENSVIFSDGCKDDLTAQASLQSCLPPDVINSGFQGPDAMAPSIDEDERFLDNENDVPNFTEIEALILESDLVPRDQDSGHFNAEVACLQYPESKKTIIRLEQGAQSCMNRAILSRGAFAVLYGRHLKYFVKDAEISLGRETEDVKVDIDLSKEGRANKISRQQAIIRLDDGGTFHIKNIGRCPIYVNGKEVPPKKRINLISGCLIEIRDMSFTFEINQRAVRRYITDSRSSRQSHRR